MSTQQKFSEGDRVRRVRGGQHINMKEGDEGTVEAVAFRGKNIIIREFKRPGWTHSADHFVKVEAPEPEPEWEPGTTGTATLNSLVSGASSLGMRAMRVIDEDGTGSFVFENGKWIRDDATTWSVSDFVPDEPRPLPTREQGLVSAEWLIYEKGTRIQGFLDQRGVLHFLAEDGHPLTTTEFGDVRPLVVLDPESDADRLSNIIRKVDDIRAVLTELGIEPQ